MIRTNKHGNLSLRLFWQGREWQERVTNRGKPAKDVPANRKRVEARAELINEEMEAGTFEYLRWFPNGNRAHEFKPNEIAAPAEIKPLTLRKFYEEWIEKKKPPFVRLSLQRDYQQNFKKNILPFMGDMELNSVTIDTLESFRIHLVDERGLALKTARNIIDGSLKAMFRDAGRRVERNPFHEIPANWWPRLPQREPDPFSEQERDAILAYYRNNRPQWSYAFVYFRFWTGTRPSECTALKWGSVDLQSSKATFSLSRHLGEENATKTRASRRTISLLPTVVELLKSILPLRVEPNSYVFTDEQGKPIEQGEFGRAFQGVLRVLKIRPRPFYNLRHTFISVALTIGCNQKWIAEQAGTSIAMIQEHYGRYIRDDGDSRLREHVKEQKNDAIEQKTGTFAGTFSREAPNYRNPLVVPTGIEPVFPT